MIMGNIKEQMEKRLAGRKFTDEQMDLWMQEDLTAEYDRILAARKRHAVIRRWAAAASILLIVGVGIMFFRSFSPSLKNTPEVQESRSSDNTFFRSKGVEGVMSSNNSFFGSAGIKECKSFSPTPNNTSDVCLTRTPSSLVPHPSSENTTADSIAKIEKVRQILAAMRQRAMDIDDSIDRKHIYDYIMSDEKLYNMGQKILCDNCPLDIDIDEL